MVDEQFECLRSAMSEGCCIMRFDTVDGGSVKVVCVLTQGENVISSREDLLGANTSVTVHPVAVLFDENIERYLIPLGGK